MNNIETWFTIEGYIGTTLTKVDPTVNNIQKIINAPTIIANNFVVSFDNLVIKGDE